MATAWGAVLVVTIPLMATTTGLTGLIPASPSIGFRAPLLLVVCRLLQGFSNGGEWGGAAAFLVEYAPAGRRGLTGSRQQFSTPIGPLSGSTSALLPSSLLSEADFYAWGWRIPFVCGFVLGPVGYYLRKKAAMFPTRVRYTGLSLSYGLAVVLFGGFAPFISTLLVDLTGNPYAPAFYVMGGGALSAIAILSTREVRDTPLE